MNNLLRLAYSYRSRARQLRKIATMDSSSQTAELLLTVADNYDEKAAAAEAIEQTHHGLFNRAIDAPQTAIENGTEPVWDETLTFSAKRHIAVLVHSVDENTGQWSPLSRDARLGHEMVLYVDPRLRAS
jgi:hypothetical protein